MTFSTPDFCAICGWTDKRDLRWGLVHWSKADPGMSYAHVGRCSDEPACRQRVRDQGDAWPLEETKRRSDVA